MPRRSTLTLSGRAVDALAVSARDVIVWDRELAGFGVRVYPSGRKVYVVQSRAGGAPRRVTLGTHGEITATQARKRAAQVIDRIKRGEEPGPLLPQAGTTVADLAERYMSAHVAQNCNAHTAGIYRGSLENHILPALGMMPLGLVERAHVSALHYRLRETPRAANRALAVLSKMFSLAAAWGLVPDGTNPCRAVRKYKERKRERFLSRDEYRRLGSVLAEAEAEAGREGAVSPYAIAALRLLMLTGCRLNEILTLRWDDVDRTAGEFRLRDGKTGTRMVPLTPTAEAVLAGIRRMPTNPWVIVGKQPGAHLPTITAEWYRLRARAGLDDVRIHDLRHSYASRALAAGESLSMIGKLLGPCRHPEHRPLRPPRARDREGVRRQGRRQHRRRHRARPRAPGRTARRELFGEPAGARLNYRVRRGRPPGGPGHGDLGPRAHRLRRPRLSLRAPRSTSCRPGARRARSASPSAATGSSARQKPAAVPPSSSPACTPARTPSARPKNPQAPPLPRLPSATCASMSRCAASPLPPPSTGSPSSAISSPPSVSGRSLKSGAAMSPICSTRFATARPWPTW